MAAKTEPGIVQLLGNCPNHLQLIGVQPEELEALGGRLTRIVMAQVSEAADLVLRYLSGFAVRDQIRAQPTVDFTAPSRTQLAVVN